MPDSEQSTKTPPKFNDNEEVTLNIKHSSTIYVVKDGDWNDSMWVYSCYKKGDDAESTLSLPEKMLHRAGPPSPGRAVIGPHR